MTVYYFNGCAIAAPITFESEEPSFLSESVSLKRYRLGQGVQRWRLTFDILINDNEEEVFLDYVINNNLTSTMTMPQLNSVEAKSYKVSGAGTPNLTVLSATTAGNTTIPINMNGFSVFIRKGAFIQVSNHSKIYALTQDFDSAVSTTMHIYPALVNNIGIGNTVRTNLSAIKPVLTYDKNLEDSIPGIRYSDGVLVEMQNISLIEAL